MKYFLIKESSYQKSYNFYCVEFISFYMKCKFNATEGTHSKLLDNHKLFDWFEVTIGFKLNFHWNRKKKYWLWKFIKKNYDLNLEFSILYQFANIKSPNSSIYFLIFKLLKDYFEFGFYFRPDYEFLIFLRILTNLLLRVIIVGKHTLKVIKYVPFTEVLFLRKQ
jgi:hypothetical protein